MKAPIACGLLIACAALFPAQHAGGQERSHRIGPARGSQITGGRVTKAHNKPPKFPMRRAKSLSTTAPTHSLENAGPDRSSNSQPELKGGKPAPVGPPIFEPHGVDSAGQIVSTTAAESDKSRATSMESCQTAFLLPVLMPYIGGTIPEGDFNGLVWNPFPWWVNIDP